MGKNITKTLIIALGGSAMLRARQGWAEEQYENLQCMVEWLPDLLSSGNCIVIIHDELQVGNLLLASGIVKDMVAPLPPGDLRSRYRRLHELYDSKYLANCQRRTGASHNINHRGKPDDSGRERSRF